MEWVGKDKNRIVGSYDKEQRVYDTREKTTCVSEMK